MVQHEIWLKTDLLKPIQPEVLRGVVFGLDSKADKIGVEVYSNGVANNLTGTVTGYVVKDDGETVNITSSVGKSQNRAWIVLPQEAYTVNGRITVTIKLTDSTTITTLCQCIAYVQRSRTTNEIIPTGTPIPDLSTLKSAINAANSAAAAANQAAAAANQAAAGSTAPAYDSIAPAYDSYADYAVGDYVTYNGRLYRCVHAEEGMIRPVHGETMDSYYWTPVTVCGEIKRLLAANNT